ncbi:MAG: RluA family pseudouridine synthase [Candidatus Caccovivens sp.]
MNKKLIIVEKDKKIVNLIQDFGFSFADVNKMLRNKDVKVNEKNVKENVSVKIGDEVVFFYSDDMLQKKYEVVFEDDDVIVVYKGAGIESDGEKGLETVLKAIAVHRLDRNTEGLMVFAKNPKVADLLLSAFKKKLVHKTYVTEVVGHFDVEQKFTAYLVKDSENSKVWIDDKKSRNATEIQTFIKTLKAGKESSLLEVELITGKTHQIRAHLAYLGHAIIGDGKYGKNEDNKKFQQNHQKLACFRLKFDFVGIKNLNFVEFKKEPKWLAEQK